MDGFLVRDYPRTINVSRSDTESLTLMEHDILWTQCDTFAFQSVKFFNLTKAPMTYPEAIACSDPPVEIYRV